MRFLFVLCICNATLLPKWALHTYDEIYGVSSFESTCALLKFSSDQRVGSSPDIPRISNAIHVETSAPVGNVASVYVCAATDI